MILSENILRRLIRESLSNAALLSENSILAATEGGEELGPAKIPGLKIDYGAGISGGLVPAEEVLRDGTGMFSPVYDFVDNRGNWKGYMSLFDICQKEIDKIITYVRSQRFLSRIQKRLSKEIEREKQKIKDYQGMRGTSYRYKHELLKSPQEIRANILSKIGDLTVNIRLAKASGSRSEAHGLDEDTSLIGEYIHDKNTIEIYIASVGDTEIEKQVFNPNKTKGSTTEFRISTPGNPQNVTVYLVKVDTFALVSVISHEILHAFARESEDQENQTVTYAVSPQVDEEEIEQRVKFEAQLGAYSDWNASPLYEIIDTSASSNDVRMRAKNLGLDTEFSSLWLLSDQNEYKGVEALVALFGFIKESIKNPAREIRKLRWDSTRSNYPLTEANHITLAYRMLRNKADELNIPMSVVTTERYAARDLVTKFEGTDRERIALLIPMLRAGSEADAASSAVAAAGNTSMPSRA
jgi:hypothetical protein